MDENRARRVVDALRDRGINAHLAKASVDQYGVRVSLPGGREAEWDTDGTAGLEAQVMRDGMLVGYVPQIEGSEDFDEQQVIDAIARTDYDQPIARQRRPRPGRPVTAARRRGLPPLPGRLPLPLARRQPGRLTPRHPPKARPPRCVHISRRWCAISGIFARFGERSP